METARLRAAGVKAARGCTGSTRLDSREFFSTRVLSVCESERAD
jgi:hypothetical protein